MDAQQFIEFGNTKKKNVKNAAALKDSLNINLMSITEEEGTY